METVGDTKLYEHDPPLLYNLKHDPSEKYNIAQKHPEVVKLLRELRRKHQATMVEGEDQLAARIPKAKQ
jgi:arylsulfatase A